VKLQCFLPLLSQPILCMRPFHTLAGLRNYLHQEVCLHRVEGGHTKLCRAWSQWLYQGHARKEMRETHSSNSTDIVTFSSSASLRSQSWLLDGLLMEPLLSDHTMPESRHLPSRGIYPICLARPPEQLQISDAQSTHTQMRSKPVGTHCSC
jgi:hypothetical protein